ncbi:MAG: hypothetical protein NWF07_09355 [Candidatus Bathyarchaeota archaeon]|nr:hypothetical protein [Candidatus Bathyarchaeota archaeon]
MKTTKPRFTILVLSILLLSSTWMLPVATAALPETPGGGDTYTDYGLLDSDTYILYPWEDTSLQVGFSKYGELIDNNMGLGLKYDGVDVFANSMVPIKDWCSGWIMDIHYTQGGYLRNTWAYALFSDRTVAGVGGEWRNEQLTKDASDPSDTPGGRRTNGYAETAPIRLIYDGEREAIYLLNTTIYDKDKAQGGVPLVELTIQLVFNKVKKYVVEIKDVKRIDNNKMDGPFQIEFSQRAEWDIGLSTAPRCYAEFYDNLTTKYIKHPFYYPEGGVPANYDLCQIIGDPSDPSENELVGFAAFWPPLISKWVTETYNVRRLSDDVDVPSLLSTMETFEHEAQLPTSANDLVDPWIYYNDTTGEIVILLPKEPVAYPRGEGEWETDPWVFREESNGEYAKLLQQEGGTPGQWIWSPDIGPYGAVRIKPFQWGWGDNFKVVYKRFMKGNTPQNSTALECMEPLFEPGDTVLSYGMNEEPDTPYVFAEWDFDLDLDHPENSTHQFRCMSVYGVTDLHNGVDPDMPEGVEEGYFRIDSEVLYQLDEVFNPIDLNDIAHKDTFRWAQKGTMTDMIVLQSHLFDKYGNYRDCLDDEHIIWFPEKWGYYCQDSEKVLAYTPSGQVLLERDTDYRITGPNELTIDNNHGADRYKVLYSTLLLPGELVLDETDFAKRKDTTTMFGVDVTRTFQRDYVEWIIDFDETDIAGHWASGADLILNAGCKLVKIRASEDTAAGYYVWDGASFIKQDFPPEIEVEMRMDDPTGTAPDYFVIRIPYGFMQRRCFEWALYVEASWPGHSSSEQMIYPMNWGGLPDNFSWDTPWLNMYKDGSCFHAGRWEWMVIGDFAAPSDSLGAAMLSSAWCDWKNTEVWLSGLDIKATVNAPSIPWIHRNFTAINADARDPYYMNPPDDNRTSFRDDWCTPDDWTGNTIYPYAISSSNMIIVGGPLANLAADYFNDFTDAKVFTEYGDGFYATGCWARTVLDHYVGMTMEDVPDNELWYSSVGVDDDVGYALISTYKDLNETVGFIVYGYTAEDTYYACYALRGGLLDWLQYVQPGTTSIILEIDYSDLHPVEFHVAECLGLFTECTGFETNFKTSDYYVNYQKAMEQVEANAECLGICYKLVDITWCAQVHPDP